eukprot:CAMPEP_0173206892 /NCGR_PEP_ID=MMETSP1141-20130122/21619_1 /TAXON_ID=483371 /ORGANISM="non described non described, Strain CCMP2298" /LENGTH=54 /DNA_ID=CAMNT_0014133095 /DNA_START=268 /DNA_END=432 /DNA_ORIENTATION=+
MSARRMLSTGPTISEGSMPAARKPPTSAPAEEPETAVTLRHPLCSSACSTPMCA